ncbi:hypothetical protein HF325_006468 [Metschnikowia pulcherrima]|uniref:Myb-like domain-containing protein n=1 Tax=Metschnikowia pulcherrima TaxID=27326 RepID=A0A8H7GLV0_9ASCO|nr:hypothetical protein HF325_006468 [Metschnikowia pulcherrima]
MSSIVKKLSHFVPKVKKRAVRREALATPPASQVTDNSQTKKDATEEPISGQHNAETYSPPATQVQSLAPSGDDIARAETEDSTTNPLLSYTISGKGANGAIKDNTEPVVDPVLKAPEKATHVSESESESDGEYGDNDIFKQPLVSQQYTRRRSSVASHRRLSGIHPNRRNSSVSISGTPAVGTAETEHAREAPVTIGVPMAKTAKKRRGSSVAHPTKKLMRGLVIAIPSVTDTVTEEQEPEPERPVVATQNSPQKTTTEDYVVGLCPKTNKLRKFKTSESVEGDLPIAPPNLVTSISSVKQLPRRVKPEEEHLYASVGVRTDAISMADLCKPLLQIGLKSETFALAEEARQKLLARKNERREARAKARELRIPYKKALRAVQGDEPEEEGPKQIDFDALAREEEVSKSSTLKLAVVDGQMQLDLESVVRGREFAPNSGNRTVELENPFQNPITANLYSRLVHTDAWTKDELVELYRALSTWGTDFSFIAQLFPYRTRRQIKNKFVLEEKHNPQLIELALRRRLPPDFEQFCARASSVSQLKLVDDFYREMAELKKDHETHLREINTERERAIKEDLETNRKREIEIRTGSKPMTKAERSRMIRQNEVVVGEIEDVKRSRDSIDAGGH